MEIPRIKQSCQQVTLLAHQFLVYAVVASFRPTAACAFWPTLVKRGSDVLLEIAVLCWFAVYLFMDFFSRHCLAAVGAKCRYGLLWKLILCYR